MSAALNIRFRALHLPLKTVFKQASSTRSKGESVWCEVQRNHHSGFGEGCPRMYVTQEDVQGSLDWLNRHAPTIADACTNLDQLKSWIIENRKEIDQHPAAFSAVESALLDLFAQEQEQSVEAMLGLASPQREYQYTAVLSDSDEGKFTIHCQQYLAAGFTDFKVKVNGDLQKDQTKLRLLRELSDQINRKNIRVRLDANNLWSGDAVTAIEYLNRLKKPLFGIEEPVEPKHYTALSQISQTLGLPIILDESLCRITDLGQLDQVEGTFIANIKVSRLGGVLRSLEMIRKLQNRGHGIIIGAHVGETSVMTRAGMCLANAAGDQLLAQEGAYGLLLLEYEPTSPSLIFGDGGRINLNQTYTAKEKEDIQEVPPENWKWGWGLKSRWK